MYREGADVPPLGAPHLARSFNHDPEVKPVMSEAHDTRMGLDTTAPATSRQPNE